jgi:hypothetical protein
LAIPPEQNGPTTLEREITIIVIVQNYVKEGENAIRDYRHVLADS